jgi:RNA polymerase-interacting CarD/CdnL/TRCF family regulator
MEMVMSRFVAKRYKHHLDKIKSDFISSIAEVVSDLKNARSERELDVTENQILDFAFKLLKEKMKGIL